MTAREPAVLGRKAYRHLHDNAASHDRLPEQSFDFAPPSHLWSRLKSFFAYWSATARPMHELARLINDEKRTQCGALLSVIECASSNLQRWQCLKQPAHQASGQETAKEGNTYISVRRGDGVQTKQQSHDINEQQWRRSILQYLS
jgi:hypothetical protein